MTNRTITIYGILFYGFVLFVNYGMNYLDEYPAAKLGNEIYLDFKLLVLQKIGRMDYSEYQKLGTGKLVQQIENGANAEELNHLLVRGFMEMSVFRMKNQFSNEIKKHSKLRE